MKVFAICLVGFVFVFLLVEVTDKIKYYFEHNPPGRLMIKYFLVKLPSYLYFALPLSILMGGMLSLLMMAKNSEIIAMQANGIDALTVARPVVLVGLIAGVIMFVSNETVIPWSNKYSEYIQNVEIAKKPDTTYIKHDEMWIRTPESIVHIGKFNKSKLLLENITVVRWDKDYNLTERIFADKAKWWTNQWIFYGVNHTIRTAENQFKVETSPFEYVSIHRTPDDFDKAQPNAKEMNMTQLGDYIAKLRAEGQWPARYLVDWYAKTAFPFICIIMASLSVPFAVKVSPRGGGIAVGLGLSLIIAFGYWIVHTIFIALGHAGYLPPIAAAWAANVLFGLLAGFLLLRAGT